MATNRKPGIDAESTAGQFNNLESRSMQTGNDKGMGDDGGPGEDNDSARDPDRNPQGSIEAIEEGDASDVVSGTAEAETRGKGDPTRSRNTDVRDNPRSRPETPDAPIE
ncbi:MAG: hypothetical protein ACR2FI_08850 [Burkholderiales bacterium]|nr:hypothetical protein [Pseudomonadota bacterium]